MEHVYLSTTGKMVEDVVYEFVAVHPTDDGMDIGSDYPVREGWRHHVKLEEKVLDGNTFHLPPEEAICVLGSETVDDQGRLRYFLSERSFRCTQSKMHVTEHRWTKPAIIHMGGHIVPNIFMVNTDDGYYATLVSSNLATQLVESGLKGFDLVPVKQERKAGQKKTRRHLLTECAGQKMHQSVFHSRNQKCLPVL